MKRLYVTAYRCRERRGDRDPQKLTARFPEAGTGAAIISHYRRLDRESGFVVHELAEDTEQETEGNRQLPTPVRQPLRRDPEAAQAGIHRFPPNGAPAYYLGRPASLWISVMSRAGSATHPNTGRTPSPAAQNERYPSPPAPSRVQRAKPCASHLSASDQ